MAKLIQDLREKKASVGKEMNLLHAKNKEKWTDDVSAKFAAKSDEYDRIEGEIKALESEAKAGSRVAEIEKTLNASIDGLVEGTNMHRSDAENIVLEERATLNAFLRGGASALTDEQRAAVRARNTAHNSMSTGTDEDGGFLVPDTLDSQILRGVEEANPVREVCRIIKSATGAEIGYPTSNNVTQKGRLLGQGAPAVQVDPVIGFLKMGAFKFTSDMILATMELLEDSAFDLVDYVFTEIAARIGRVESEYNTTGAGGGVAPEGLVTAASLGHTTVLADGFTYDDVMELFHSVHPFYRKSPTTGWMFQDNTLLKFKKLKDGEGRPLWLPGLTGSDPETINGKKFTLNEDMDNVASSNFSMVFGDFSQFAIRDVGVVRITRLVEKYADTDQLAWVAFKRQDSKLLNADGKALKKMQHAA